MGHTRKLVVVLGDQLDIYSGVFEDFDDTHDIVWMAEAASEGKYVWSHKLRIALFLSAMRHFRDSLLQKNIRIEYSELNDSGDQSLFDLLGQAIERHEPDYVQMVLPGSWRMLQGVQGVCSKLEVDLDVLDDQHFYTTPEMFRAHSAGRKSLRMEYFYRELRQKNRILMSGDKPIGGKWNYDQANRGSFGKSGPKEHFSGPPFEPDAITRDVMDQVGAKFSTHPGALGSFRWPVTPEAARRALDCFVEERLPYFGEYQDAMWSQETWLYHSWISSSLNLKLLNPREAVDAAVGAYEAGSAPLESVEGFVRQILGWREYVRGVYWLYMPEYLDRNAMGASAALPDFFWTGETDFECLRQSIGQTLEYGYAHHIQRLMVTGLYCLLLGVEPRAVHEWYLAVYVDAVEWVELPNTLGMSQYADGGVMASKPYVASGKYIDRMSNYCASCPKNPAKRVGEEACPFTTLYWDYLIRHEKTLSKNHRMGFQLKNLKRLSAEQKDEIQEQARIIRKNPEGNAPDG